SAERAPFFEERELGGVSSTVRVGGPESNRAEDAGQKGDVIVLQRSLQLAPLLQLGDHVEAQDISLSFFQGASLLLQGLPHRSLAVDGVLDPQPVRHFVEHDIGKERIEIEVASLVLSDE